MMRVRVDGLAAVDKALGDLPKRVAKATLVRVGKKRLQPVADRANELAPDDPATPGGLHTSFKVSTQLNKRQKALRRKAVKAGEAEKYFAEVFAGTADPAGVFMEFGTVHHGPQPSLRPAWDEKKDGLLDGLAADLWAEIEKAAKREAAKGAK
jgi:hypothetical protein